MCDGCKGPCRITPDGKVKNWWWDKAPGFVKDEVRAALRRSNDEGVPRWLQRAKLPTLAASSKRLRNAELTLEVENSRPKQWWSGGRMRTGDEMETYMETIEVWRGPKAAEEYVAYRREQLGLSNEWPKETAVAA